MAKDPVCNMNVDEEQARYTSTYQGKTWYFCSADCKKAFELDPEKYAAEKNKEQAGSAE
ncbi:MAG: YHS domain-containing protein [Desulfobulbaceae bacterium]|nr:YHS domain-containing protein [Desulfobulbaceae bacterium]